MNTNLKFLAPALALPLALGLSAPANAGVSASIQIGWSDHRQASYAPHYKYRQSQRYANPRLERRIDRLARDIRDARRSGEISRYHARTMRQRLRTLERNYVAFARNGISRSERRTLRWRIGRAEEALARVRFAQNPRYDRRARYNRDRDNRWRS